MKDVQEQAQSREDFEARLRAIGAQRYHDRHPFHERLHGGHCTPDEVRAWVINRWMYQSRIPMKDAAFMSRVEDPDLRRAWRKRIEDHDGGVTEGGGIRRWLALAQAVGLDPDYVASGVGIMPATRFAVDAYVRFVRDMPLLDAVAAKRYGGLEDPRVGSVPVNFLSDLDITGGNSGSPVLDAHGKLVGLAGKAAAEAFFQLGSLLLQAVSDLADLLASFFLKAAQGGLVIARRSVVLI